MSGSLQSTLILVLAIENFARSPPAEGGGVGGLPPGWWLESQSPQGYLLVIDRDC